MGSIESTEPEVEKITVHYSDGTTKEFEKGFFCEFSPLENGEQTLSFIRAHCTGRDLETIISGCVQLGVQLGMFNK